MDAVRCVTSREAWAILKAREDAVLVDVRTDAEWDFVGVPLVGRYVQASWQDYPDMRRNPDFLAEIRAAGLKAEQPLLLLCKAGTRSLDAARFLLRNGFVNVYNISDGFEGERNALGQRRCVDGWIAAGLPWMQC